MLNVFHGGPNDGESHKTEDLLVDQDQRAAIPWSNYKSDREVDVEDGVRHWHWSEYQVPVPAPREAASTTRKPRAAAGSTVPKSDFRVRREALGWSRGKMSKESGLTISAVCRLEVGKGSVSEVAQMTEILNTFEKEKA